MNRSVSDLVIELPNRWNAGVAADLDLPGLDHDRQAGEKTEADLRSSLSDHHRPSCLELTGFQTVT